jgi:hypothetical protein
MREFRLGMVPSSVVEYDGARFNPSAVNTVIQHSGLALDPDVIRRYCEWFVGKGFDWKESNGDDWREGYGTDWLGCLGQHLGHHRDERLRHTTLYMTCKAGSNGGRPYYWTRYLAIDIDNRPGQPPDSLRERYERCVRVLEATPVVLRSPRHGLHVLFALAIPVSTLGLIHTFKPDLPVLIPTVLEADGIDIRPAWVELLPTSTHTLRMPLAWGTVQLDSGTLAPLPDVPRADEIARLVDTMEAAARTQPLDAFALAERCRSSARRRRPAARRPCRISPPGNNDIVATWARPVDEIDADRLEREGLYPGVTRNAAAMALARRKMLALGCSATDTVDFLMQWTATMCNGLSQKGALLPCADTEVLLRGHYHRITRGILRGLKFGKVAVGIGGGTGRPITDAEAQWVFEHTSAITDPCQRYKVEVFLFCVIGFAKDRGRVAIGPARYRGADVVHAQLSSKLMESWPFSGAGNYRRWLDWAEESGFTRMVLNYRHSQDPALCRSRTFELEVEQDGLSGIGVTSGALLDAAQMAQDPRRPRVHPRQVEHALYCLPMFETSLSNRYGGASADRIVQLVRAYDSCREPGGDGGRTAA